MRLGEGLWEHYSSLAMTMPAWSSMINGLRRFWRLVGGAVTVVDLASGVLVCLFWTDRLGCRAQIYHKNMNLSSNFAIPANTHTHIRRFR